MEHFLTWDILLTYAGCVAGTVILTEFVKKLFPQVIAQLISFVIAIAILIFGHLAMKDFTYGEIPLYLINAVAVSLAANGGFDILKNAFGKTVVVDNELIVGEADENGNAEVYLSVNEDPDMYRNGDILTFKVHKVTQKESQKEPGA